jgi:hypothetical protein
MKIYSSRSTHKSPSPKPQSHHKSQNSAPQKGAVLADSDQSSQKKIPLLRGLIVVLVLWWAGTWAVHKLSPHFSNLSVKSAKAYFQGLKNHKKSEKVAHEVSSSSESSSSSVKEMSSQVVSVKNLDLNSFARELNSKNDALKYSFTTSELSLEWIQNTKQISEEQKPFLIEGFQSAVTQGIKEFSIEFALNGHNRKSALGVHAKIGKDQFDYSLWVDPNMQQKRWIETNGCIRGEECMLYPVKEWFKVDSQDPPLWFHLQDQQSTPEKAK